MKNIKKILLAFAVTTTSLLALMNKAAAQDFIQLNEEDMRILYGPVNIKKPDNFVNTNNVKDVSERAVKNFRKSYPSVTNEEWSVTNKHRYLAIFNVGGTQTIVAYNQNGSLHHTISYYGEAKLPQELRHIVKSVYYNYLITGIAEININDAYIQTTYVVYITDGYCSKKLTVCNDEILSVQDTANVLSQSKNEP